MTSSASAGSPIPIMHVSIGGVLLRLHGDIVLLLPFINHFRHCI